MTHIFLSIFCLSIYLTYDFYGFSRFSPGFLVDSIAGGLLSYFRGLLGSREMRILILGLDGAGKTTILYRLQVGEVVTTIPTIGFNVEQVTYKNLKFQVWDLGGQTSIRPYWRCYYSNTDAIIYVVDSVDRDRIGISKDELLYMLRVSSSSIYFLQLSVIFKWSSDCTHAHTASINCTSHRKTNWLAQS